MRHKSHFVTKIISVVVVSLLCSAPLLAQGPLGFSKGTHQVLIIHEAYANTTPATTGAQWSTAMNNMVDTYYNAATNNKCRFTFTHAGSLSNTLNVVPLPFTYDQTPPGSIASPLPPGGFGIFDVYNDPLVMQREIAIGIEAVDLLHPGVIGTVYRNIIIVVNGDKRGHTLPVYPFAVRVPGTQLYRLVNLGVTLVPESTTSVVWSDGTTHNVGTVTTADISKVAHELGHQIALPDLYYEQSIASIMSNVPGYSSKEFTECWDQMGLDNLQNFSGYSRALMGWIPRYHLKKALPAPAPAWNHYTIYPPMRSTHHHDIELLQLYVDPFSAFNYNEQQISYLVEARTSVPSDNLDTNRQTIIPGGAVIPDAVPATHKGPSIGLPTDYVRGVTVSLTQPWIPGGSFPPLNPLLYIPHSENPPNNSSNNRQLKDAAYNKDETFFASEIGLTVRVDSINSDGSAKVSVQLQPVPRPDVMPVHCWLDNPSNGFGNYWSPLDPEGDPIGFGDPIYKGITVTWVSHNPFPPTPKISEQIVTHRLHFRVINMGSADAKKVVGTAFLINPQLPAFTGTITQETINKLNPFKVINNIDFGSIPAGGTGHAFVDIQPDKPFSVILLLNQTEATPHSTLELNLANNWRYDSFMIVQINPGSPYQPIDMKLPVVNTDIVPHVVYAAPKSDLPLGWNGTITSSDPKRLLTPLDIGKQDTYQLHIEPVDPSRDKPEQIRPIDIYGWMNYADSWVPMSKMQLNVVMSYKTLLAIDVRGAKPFDFGTSPKIIGSEGDPTNSNVKDTYKPVTEMIQVNRGKSRPSKPFNITVTGVLSRITLEHRSASVPGEPVIVYVYGDDGSTQVHLPGSLNYTGTTDRSGRFTQAITLRTGVKYIVTAKYGGSVSYTPAESGSYLYQ